MHRARSVEKERTGSSTLPTPQPPTARTLPTDVIEFIVMVCFKVVQLAVDLEGELWFVTPSNSQEAKLKTQL